MLLYMQKDVENIVTYLTRTSFQEAVSELRDGCVPQARGWRNPSEKLFCRSTCWSGRSAKSPSEVRSPSGIGLSTCNLYLTSAATL